jgi:hypothetical protein
MTKGKKTRIEAQSYIRENISNEEDVALSNEEEEEDKEEDEEDKMKTVRMFEAFMTMMKKNKAPAKKAGGK